MKKYAWPGNVRELENLVRRLAALYPQEEISAEIIESELRETAAVSRRRPRQRLAAGRRFNRPGGRAQHAAIFRRLWRRSAARRPL